MSYARPPARRRAAPKGQMPRIASADYVARLLSDLRGARKACSEIVDIIDSAISRRALLAHTRSITESEVSRIRELAAPHVAAADVQSSSTTSSTAEASSTWYPPPGDADAASDPPVPVTPNQPPTWARARHALTVRYPWAALFFKEHGKTIETRPQATSFRGPLAIHAGKLLDLNGPRFDTGLLDKLVRAFGVQREGVLAHIGDPVKNPRGYVLGEVDLVACARIESLDVGPSDVRLFLRLDGKPTVKVISRTELAFGDYNPGRYVYLTENPRPYPRPVYARGNQGFWIWRAA